MLTRLGFRREKLRVISDAAENAALRRMEYNARTEITGHRFRAMAPTTILQEVLGVTNGPIEHHMAHRLPDTLGAAYKRTKFINKIMQQWAHYLNKLKAEAETRFMVMRCSVRITVAQNRKICPRWHGKQSIATPGGAMAEAGIDRVDFLLPFARIRYRAIERFLLRKRVFSDAPPMPFRSSRHSDDVAGAFRLSAWNFAPVERNIAAGIFLRRKIS